MQSGDISIRYVWIPSRAYHTARACGVVCVGYVCVCGSVGVGVWECGSVGVWECGREIECVWVCVGVFVGVGVLCGWGAMRHGAERCDFHLVQNDVFSCPYNVAIANPCHVTHGGREGGCGPGPPRGWAKSGPPRRTGAGLSGSPSQSIPSVTTQQYLDYNFHFTGPAACGQKGRRRLSPTTVLKKRWWVGGCVCE